ncbi:DUF4225 domain-containing protein [Pseudomonas sp. NPDC087814]|jgi:hypothetical protein|uniref:DUF4225 domain-containing protein n=1 Tax=unclassified Pseudomonas TaxID=196821 RepID=UPI001EE65FC5|nr:MULTISPECIES: DUF4225 domain-containing protein [unclassified Pseudomonas]
MLNKVRRLLRKGYHSALSAMGYGEREANMAYGSVDIGLSAYSVTRHVLKPDAWRLFRYLNTDKIRAYKTMGPTSLAFEAGADVLTLKNLYQETKN